MDSEMSDGTPVSPELDARMLANLREWRARHNTGLRHLTLTIDELDMLLRVAAERDALKAAAVEEDERVIAWDQIAAHPFFRDCYGTETSLLEAMLAKLTDSTFTAEITAEVRERAGSTALGIPYAEPTREPDECGGCVEDIAGVFGLYCSACGKPRPRRRTNCRCSVTPILHGHPAPDEVSIEITAKVPVSRPVDERDLLPFCNCGSVDKNGDDLGEHGDACPYHLAVLGLSPMVSARELDELCRRTLAAQARLA